MSAYCLWSDTFIILEKEWVAISTLVLRVICSVLSLIYKVENVVLPSPFQAMDSEEIQMRRQTSQSDNSSQASSQCRRRPNTCCFCWCCCCSCLTVRNKDIDDHSQKFSIISKQDSLQKQEERLSVNLDEVISWSKSFEHLLKDPNGRKFLSKFLQSEHSDENILFWLACEEFKQEDQKTSIMEKATSIYFDYISVLSPKEISIDASVREAINKNMATPTTNIFDEAQMHVYALMHRDSYPRFLNSPLYKSLLKELSPSDNGMDSDL
ncbi:regulator of G-protein signaling 17-like isoform X1 [Hypanus sabinus]|uniref:regulator of G-protein signaling 17-like isoform X1 n=2 Tax=Hypanus sabinus TaxID=79690 RepID=UPI0028C4CFB6|nr:regulator of G-protein signaling 17-like isoform X1 [Hypanus sabinus]